MAKLEITNMVMVQNLNTEEVVVQNRIKNWCGISFPGGHAENGETIYDSSIREIKEETGIASRDCRLIRRGSVINISSIYEGKVYEWSIYPFLFATKTNEIFLDWEHTEYRWVKPKDIRRYKTVPKLKEVFNAVSKYGHLQPHD